MLYFVALEEVPSLIDESSIEGYQSILKTSRAITVVSFHPGTTTNDPVWKVTPDGTRSTIFMESCNTSGDLFTPIAERAF
jgi:hypothetical protein